jgi:hypothetical protein
MLDTEEVPGSNPASPTIDESALARGNADQGLRQWLAADPHGGRGLDPARADPYHGAIALAQPVGTCSRLSRGPTPVVVGEVPQQTLDSTNRQPLTVLR